VDWATVLEDRACMVTVLACLHSLLCKQIQRSAIGLENVFKLIFESEFVLSDWKLVRFCLSNVVCCRLYVVKISLSVTGRIVHIYPVSFKSRPIRKFVVCILPTGPQLRSASFRSAVYPSAGPHFTSGQLVQRNATWTNDAVTSFLTKFSYVEQQ